MTHFNQIKMEKLTKSVVFVTFCTLLFKSSYQIYVPENEQYQKPVTNTPGIKTYVRPSQIQYHHNYSQVKHQNYDGHAHRTFSTEEEEVHPRPFPVYNAHTYGVRPQQSERQTVYVINGSRIRKNENPTRQVVMYNKQKRTPKIEVYRSCPYNATGQLVYEFSCNQFLNCWKGRGYVQNCAPGTLFNPKTLECDFPQKVECITGPRLSILQRERSAKIVQQIGCPKEFSGLIPNYTDCSKFINCVSGIENFMDCPPGTLFDIDKNICDFAEKANCFNRQNENLKRHNVDGKLNFGTDCNRGICTDYNQRGGLSYRDNEIRCPENADGLHRHPTDCSKFLNCAHGRTYIQDCAPGTLFNPTLKICDFPYNVRCEIDHRQQYSTDDRYNKLGENQYRPSSYESSTHPYHYRPVSTYESSTTRYTDTDQQLWNQDNRYNKGSSVYTTNYGDNRNTLEEDQYYNQPSIDTHTINKGSVGIYQPGESGIYGAHNRTIGIYRQGEPNTYGTTTWPQRTRDQQIYTNTQNNYHRDPYGTQIGSYDQNYYHKGSLGHESGFYVTTYNNQYGRTEPNPYNGQNYGYSRDPYDRRESVPTGTYGVNTNQNRWGQDTYNKGTVGTDHQVPIYYRDRNNYGRDQNYKGSSTPQTGTYGRTDYRDSYNQRPNIYEQRPNQFESTNRLDQETYHRKGDDDYNGQTQHSGYGNRYNQQRPYGGSHTQNKIDDDDTPNYSHVVNINNRPTTIVPIRRPYEPFFGTTTKPHASPPPRDYDDTFGVTPTKYIVATTPHVVEKNWPPAFPSTDVNADYFFEYDDIDQVTLEAENSLKNYKKSNGTCGKTDFQCSLNLCIPKTLVCNGDKDCPHGNDELKCLEYVAKYSVNKNHKLAILEKERWDNITIATCALLCIETRKFQCKSFNYRKIDKTCFLSDTNEGLTGALISYPPFDYYELISEKIDCSNKYICSNKKCIDRNQICDGHDDCGDRMDEKGCKPEDFGYSIRLTGSNNKNEGQIEVTAFGKTGFVCDDKFGLRDANVVCKELGFDLGAVEVKGNSFYANKTISKKPFYMMDDVTCTGNETRLMDCDFNGWGVHNCLGQEVVGVVCKTPHDRCADDYWQCDSGRECLPFSFVCDGLLDCTDGSDEKVNYCDAPTEIRLVNGSSRQQGRVEIKHHGVWGTICDDDFNEDAAKVVCRQLGYKGSAVVKKDGYFGAGSGPIWLDQVFCSGNESAVQDCTHWNWGEHNCEHSEDVGVICSNIYQHERHTWSPLPKIPQRYPDKCGYRKDNIFNRDDNVHFRVVRGSIARRGDYPWQAAIRVKGKPKNSHWCGAVVISENFVLTAAHCLLGYTKGAYVVVAGDYNVDEDEGTEQEAYIEDFYIHENFRHGHKMNNDIALVKLKGRGFRLNEDIQPICLPENTTQYESELNCTISGFGSIESGKSAFSHDLRAGWIPIQKREICTMPHVYGDALTEGMICAGSLDEGIDSCDGDSGGPLACLHNGVFTLYGITSWGQRCGYANKPGVYVKVAHYREWIDNNFRKYST